MTTKGAKGETIVEPSDDVFPAGWAGWLPVVVLVDLVAVLAGLVLIWWTPNDLSPGFSFAGALLIVVFVTFGGVLARTGSMRTSLGATLFLTYMVLAIIVLNFDAFAEHLENYRVPESVFQTLAAAFTTVLVFYFGSEAYIKATSIRKRRRPSGLKGVNARVRSAEYPSSRNRSGRAGATIGRVPPECWQTFRPSTVVVSTFQSPLAMS